MAAAIEISYADPNQLIRRILRRQFDRIEQQEAAIQVGTDLEALHDFRVAVRRCRTLLGQCRFWLADSVMACRPELAWLGQQTSTFRDLDVLLENLPGYLEALPAATREDLLPLRQSLLIERQARFVELCRLFKEEPYLTFKLRLRRCLESHERLLNGRGEASTVPELVTATTGKAFRRVLRQGRTIGLNGSDEELHRLRKSGKKFRYLLEFFRDFYPARAGEEILAELKNLQDNLGSFQDLSVQIDRLEELGRCGPLHQDFPDVTLAAMWRLLVELQARQQTCRAEFDQRFQKFFQQSETHGWLRLISEGEGEHGGGNRTEISAGE